MQVKLKSRPTQASIECRVRPELLSRVEACGPAKALLRPKCVGISIVATSELAKTCLKQQTRNAYQDDST